MRFYGFLLRLYPASFRAEYGEDMRRLFARRRREASGPGEAAVLWVSTVFDVAVSACRTHADLLRQDLRYAARALSRAPGFAATAIVVAGVGIGAATASYSVLDHVLVRPLPFAEGDRLVDLWENDTLHGYGRTELSPANYRDWKSASRSFEGMAAFTNTSVNLAGDGNPERLDGALATPDLFEVLRVRAALGRVLTEADGRSGAEKTVVISDGLWRRRFGGDPNVLGRKLLLDDPTHHRGRDASRLPVSRPRHRHLDSLSVRRRRFRRPGRLLPEERRAAEEGRFAGEGPDGDASRGRAARARVPQGESSHRREGPAPEG
jgi:putative ABC transport system permease protein